MALTNAHPPRDIDLHMPLDMRTKDAVDAVGYHAIDQRLGILIMTKVNEIPHEPTIGTEIDGSMFETHWVAADLVDEIVRDVVRDKEHRIELIGVEALEHDRHVLAITVTYKLPAAKETHDYTIKLRLQ